MKRLLNILILLLGLLPLSAQVDKYPYVVVDDNADSFQLSDSTFYQIAKSIVFPVNKYDIPSDCEFRNEIVNEIVPYINAHGLQLQKIIIRGAASPEGAYAWNDLLSNRRAQAIVNLVNEYEKVPCQNIITDEVSADYEYLLRMMKANNDADYEKVASIVHKYHGKDLVRIKTELKSINYMKLWKRLLNEYFPQLRTARFVLVFSKPKGKDGVGLDVGENAKDDLAIQPSWTLPIVPDVTLNVPTPIADFSGRNKCVNGEPLYPVLSVKTNLLYDFLWTPKTGFQPSPNIEAELYLRNGKYSILAEYEFPWWKNEAKKEFFQLQNEQLEGRYYFNQDHYFNGLFVGPYLMANRFDFALKGNDGSGVQGEGIGAGVSVGYVLPLGGKTSRWKVEFNIKAGYYETHYDPYDYKYSEETQTGKYYYRYTGDVDAFRVRNWRYRWVGPTGIGITLSYDLIRGYRSLNRKK